MILIALVLITMGILIYGPSFASQELEDAASEDIDNLLAEIPDNQELYRNIYGMQLPDSLMAPVNRLHAQLAQIDGIAANMWALLDSANARRTNKNHNFLLKQGYAGRFGESLHQAEKLILLIGPDLADSLQLHVAEQWQEKNLSGHPVTAQKYLADWILRLKRAERSVLEGLKGD